MQRTLSCQTQLWFKREGNYISKHIGGVIKGTLSLLFRQILPFTGLFRRELNWVISNISGTLLRYKQGFTINNVLLNITKFCSIEEYDV